MNEQMKEMKQKTSPLKKWIFPSVIVVIFIVVFVINFDMGKRSLTTTWQYFIEMAIILPPVFLLMGLIEVWLPKKKIETWLGHKSGIRGALFSIALGTLPTGPLYVAFPMTKTLLNKGASISNMVLFLGAWAALKIPQLMIEIKFLGLPFTLLRFSLTLLFLVLIGKIMNAVIQKDKQEVIDK